ncbi:hypothetical protein GJAV_G00152250 [Gymnothorax javanicus]|nr:hypothetical protein GJAV_G00152250 [Gymnothorax javanicus]
MDWGLRRWKKKANTVRHIVNIAIKWKKRRTGSFFLEVTDHGVFTPLEAKKIPDWSMSVSIKILETQSNQDKVGSDTQLSL